jgi:hypothetical protein
MDLAGRLNDTVKPNLIGYQQITFAELAQQIHEAWGRTDAYWKERQGAGMAGTAKG